MVMCAVGAATLGSFYATLYHDLASLMMAVMKSWVKEKL
jgi:hypothetical protein